MCSCIVQGENEMIKKHILYLMSLTISVNTMAGVFVPLNIGYKSIMLPKAKPTSTIIFHQLQPNTVSVCEIQHMNFATPSVKPHGQVIKAEKKSDTRLFIEAPETAVQHFQVQVNLLSALDGKGKNARDSILECNTQPTDKSFSLSGSIIDNFLDLPRRIKNRLISISPSSSPKSSPKHSPNTARKLLDRPVSPSLRDDWVLVSESQ